MPAETSYPGVYIHEKPSGADPITGVATSIAAFVGWSARGPVDRAELVLSWSDFERKFGGLDGRSLLGYAVSQFYTNGGERAYVVRLAANDAAKGSVTLDGKLTVTARNPGVWAANYAIVTKMEPTPDAGRFQLKVIDIRKSRKGMIAESHENLSMNPVENRFVLKVLNRESNLIEASIIGNKATPPADTVVDPASDGIAPTADLKGGADGMALDPQNPASFVAAGKILDPAATTGIFLLDHVELYNLLCVPGLSDTEALCSLEKFCYDRRVFLIADCAPDASLATLQNGPNGSLTGTEAINAALYFPWVMASDPLQRNRPREFPPCGFVSGIFARTDAKRGVWNAPTGAKAVLASAVGVKSPLTDDENGVLGSVAVNCIRNLPIFGTVLWGGRTLQGGDQRDSVWKYVSVRRTALFIEETLHRALNWVVFEPNGESLWSQIRLNVGAFMRSLFRQGALQGQRPQEAYFVKCDEETTTQSDIEVGIVNIVVGFAPLKPAEFVIVNIRVGGGQS